MIQRPGMANLISWLASTDYFEAPASTRYHRAVSGGLAVHSYKTKNMFHGRLIDLGIPFPLDSIMIVGDLHDANKIGLYYFEDGMWKCNYAVLTQGHGARSVKLIKQFIELTPEEEAIIRYHMGPFGAHESGCKGTEYSLKEYIQACNKYPLIGLFHACDNDEARWMK